MMKHLLPLVLLLIISLPRITATGDANATQLIYDTDGRQLTSLSVYYILPAQKGTSGGGGGLKPNSLRPFASFVTQARSEADHGDPVVFRPLTASSDGIIRLSTDHKIIFDIITTRFASLSWYVRPGSLPSSEPRQRVAVLEDHTLPRGFVFRVERHVVAGATKGYKLVWCADGAKKPCRDLGLYESEGKTWLAITSDSPFVVVFKKRGLSDVYA